MDVENGTFLLICNKENTFFTSTLTILIKSKNQNIYTILLIKKETSLKRENIPRLRLILENSPK